MACGKVTVVALGSGVGGKNVEVKTLETVVMIGKHTGCWQEAIGWRAKMVLTSKIVVG